jgi:AcrR family transcriptional regulator
VRREQVELTRRRTLEAARELFAERGYTDATVDLIATRAGIAAPTIYANFGSKRQLLTALVLGLKEQADVYATVEQISATQDAETIIQLAAKITRSFHVLAWDVLDVLRAAAKADPGLHSLWDQVEGARLRDQIATVQRLAEAGILPTGYTVAQAADLFWAITSPDMYRLLVVERGWSTDAYEQWLVRSLTALLLG